MAGVAASFGGSREGDEPLLSHRESSEIKSEPVIVIKPLPRTRKLTIHFGSDFMDDRKNEEKRCRSCCGSLDRQRLFESIFWCFRSESKLHPLDIQLPVRSVDALMGTEPCMFGFYKLDSDVCEFLIDKCGALGHKCQSVNVHVFSIEEGDSECLEELRRAFANTFRYEGRKANTELVRALYDGLKAGAIGFLVFAVCVGIIIALYATVPDSKWVQFFAQILVIMIWVAVWNPIEQLVFGRYQIRRRCRLCKVLSEATVTLNALKHDAALALDEFIIEVNPDGDSMLATLNKV